MYLNPGFYILKNARNVLPQNLSIKGKLMKNKELRRRIKEAKSEYTRYIILKCKKCGVEYRIRTDKNTIDKYTKEYKDNYVCVVCK